MNYPGTAYFCNNVIRYTASQSRSLWPNMLWCGHNWIYNPLFCRGLNIKESLSLYSHNILPSLTGTFLPLQSPHITLMSRACTVGAKSCFHLAVQMCQNEEKKQEKTSKHKQECIKREREIGRGRVPVSCCSYFIIKHLRQARFWGQWIFGF